MPTYSAFSLLWRTDSVLTQASPATCELVPHLLSPTQGGQSCSYLLSPLHAPLCFNLSSAYKNVPISWSKHPHSLVSSCLVEYSFSVSFPGSFSSFQSLNVGLLWESMDLFPLCTHSLTDLILLNTILTPVTPKLGSPTLSFSLNSNFLTISTGKSDRCWTLIFPKQNLWQLISLKLLIPQCPVS